MEVKKESRRQTGEGAGLVEEPLSKITLGRRRERRLSREISSAKPWRLGLRSRELGGGGGGGGGGWDGNLVS